MKVIALILILSAAASARPRRWELIPTKDGGVELFDLTQPLPEVRVDASDVVFQLYTNGRRERSSAAVEVGSDTEVVAAPVPEADDDSGEVVADTVEIYSAVRLSPNPSSPQILTTGGSYVGNFVASKQTKFVTHGWMNQGDHMSAIRDGWLQAGDYNVIVVDWSVHAGNWNYAQAKAAVSGVGEVVAAFINWLASLGASTNNMQLVGHSLGAHVFGVAGNRVTAGRLNRITGMDPAAPLFGIESTADRLDASDASFVQVIHTSIVFPGWKDALGSVDFYPNGGSSQPGCGIDAGGVCSHGRSTEFFAESITTATGFNAHQCGSWNEYNSGSCDGNPTALMGETVSTSASRTYYLATASSSPYALG
ncbi:phospholipase A1 VesT1.02-like [Schistocerca serialis cubense]|uniref:phospholipase A1 VesT1.02-like n=1 Tax=Schistocerca serialis cubense TaxID=2023355 RepID=UPI00214EB6A9|nr:phospholipase A1 VesT1.02-like [Schistocerca serialis cubense]